MAEKAKVGEELKEQAKELFNEVVDPLKKELKELEEKFLAREEEGLDTKEIGAQMENLATKIGEAETSRDEFKERLDGIATKLSKIEDSGAPVASLYANDIKERLENSEEFKSWLGGGKGGFDILNEKEFKAVGNITFGNQTGNQEPSSFQEQTIYGTLPRKLWVRNIPGVRTVSFTGQDYWYVTLATGEGAVGSNVSEGGAKPQTDNDWTNNKVPLQEIAHHKKVSERMLRNYPAMVNAIVSEGVKEYMRVEDTNLLSDLQAGASEPDPLPADKVTAANKWDVILHSAFKIDGLDGTANAVLMHPQDLGLSIMEKDNDARYLSPFTWQGGQYFVGGIPIYTNTGVERDKFYVMDTVDSFYIVQNGGLRTEFGFDASDFTNNLRTVRIEGRVGLATPKPLLTVYGDFSQATDSLSNPVA